MTSYKESTIMFKCGLLSGDGQLGDFRFISWFYGQQKPYIRQQRSQTLAERLKIVFPDIVSPFQVVFIDENDDKIILPIDDVKETVTAMQCFGYLTSTPIQIFIQLHGTVIPDDGIKCQQQKTASKCNCDNRDIIIQLTDKLSQLESTIHVLGLRIVTLLENLSEKHSEKNLMQESIPPEETATIVLDESESAVAESTSDLHMEAPSSARPRSDSSSSSFSVQSQSGEEDWTRVGAGGNGGPRRRRFTTESSCASSHSHHFQDGVLLSMEDELHSMNFGLTRNP